MQNRKERDHDVRGTKGVRSFHDWLREQVAANRPWDELARDVLTASGKTHRQPGRRLLHRHRRRAARGRTSRRWSRRWPRRSSARASAAPSATTTRWSSYTQDDYYHFAAFFSRCSCERKDPKQGPTTLLVVGTPTPNQNKNPVGVTQPRTGQFLKPQPLDRSAATVEPGDDPRADAGRRG